METAIVRQLLDFFQDFLELCQLENWPQNETTEKEIKNAFLIALHVDKCLLKLQRKNLITEFLSTLNSHQDISQCFLKNCFGDPPKYILNKIINSQAKISQLDTGFKVFLQLFPEEKLQSYLADFMVESASKRTLLNDLTTNVSKEKLLEFKSLLLLSELNDCDDSTDSLTEMIQNPNRDIVAILIVSLSNKDPRYYKAVKSISKAFLQTMLCRNHTYKQFWKYLFSIDEGKLTKMCLEQGEIYKNMVNALLDCGKLLREQMSAEYFYIELTYSELVVTVQKMCANFNLKLEFFDIANQSDTDVSFWENMVT